MAVRLNIYKSSFFYLLVLFVTHAIVTSISSPVDHSEFPTAVLFTFILLFCFMVIPHEKFLIIFTIALGTISILSHLVMSFTPHPGLFLHVFLYVTNIIFLFIITYSVLYTVTKHKQISADTLFGAINGYFLLGYTWGFIYLLIATINPHSFSNPLLHATTHDREQFFIYFSFTTMTTLGYGDMLPLSNLARTCAWLQAVVGQIYLAVWISQLVGLRIMQKKQ